MSVLTQSCSIEFPGAEQAITHPARALEATVSAIEVMTSDIRRIRMHLSAPLLFSPGQYATLQFAPQLVRPYSMAGLCTDDQLEFHVRLMPDGRVSGYIAHKLNVGDAVHVTAPLGTAYLRTKHAGPMLCIADSTGLASVLSIVRGALAEGMANPIHVYLGVRAPDDLYGADWLRVLADRHPNLHVHIVVVSGNGNPSMRNGIVTDAVAQDWGRLVGWRAYLRGTPVMVEAATFLVRQKGIRQDHIYADAFYASDG